MVESVLGMPPKVQDGSKSRNIAIHNKCFTRCSSLVWRIVFDLSVCRCEYCALMRRVANPSTLFVLTVAHDGIIPLQYVNAE